MKDIDFNKYDVEIILSENKNEDLNVLIRHLQSIVMDRSIPEENKRLVRKQIDEAMKFYELTMNPPTYVLKEKKE